ncbi:MAG: acetyl-coenzyme A synthetase, partial [Proteobacteria bacterium]
MSSTEDKITCLSSEKRIFEPPVNGCEHAYVGDIKTYEEACRRSLDDPEAYWAERAEELVSWYTKWDTVLDADMYKPEIRWFDGATLNVSYNCLDRHLENGRKNKTAIIWQGEREDEVRTYCYQELYEEVCRFANVLKKKGVRKGDRVAVYLPMIPELAVTLLACARIGAIHSVVFAGFSAASLQNRIEDCEARVVVTADAVLRSGKTISLKSNVDEALEECDSVEHCIVVRRADIEIAMQSGRDCWWHEEMAADGIEPVCQPEHMEAEDTLFILYTSGSTGQPKGVVHTTGGYLTYVLHTTQWIFD